jgi:hypothetical protein
VAVGVQRDRDSGRGLAVGVAGEHSLRGAKAAAE